MWVVMQLQVTLISKQTHSASWQAPRCPVGLGPVPCSFMYKKAPALPHLPPQSRRRLTKSFCKVSQVIEWFTDADLLGRALSHPLQSMMIPSVPGDIRSSSSLCFSEASRDKLPSVLKPGRHFLILFPFWLCLQRSRDFPGHLLSGLELFQKTRKAEKNWEKLTDPL